MKLKILLNNLWTWDDCEVTLDKQHIKVWRQNLHKSLGNHYRSGHTKLHHTGTNNIHTLQWRNYRFYFFVCFLNSSSEIVQGCANIEWQSQSIDLTLGELRDGQQEVPKKWAMFKNTTINRLQHINVPAIGQKRQINKYMCVVLHVCKVWEGQGHQLDTVGEDYGELHSAIRLGSSKSYITD